MAREDHHRAQLNGINSYQPREQFKAFHNRPNRWAVMVCHRRAGKTVSCVADLVYSALVTKKTDARYAYIAPQYNQAKDVAWLYLKRLTSDIPNVKYNESDLWAELPNGARIRLYGAENESRLRGLYLDGVILDEYADMNPKVWGEIVRPMLTDRKGWAVFIGTPKGHNAFHEVWINASEDWFKMMLKASESGIVDEIELAEARKDMTDDQFEQEFQCSFEAAIRGAVYAKYIKEDQITNVQYDPKIQVHTSWDLGVGDSTAIWFWQVVGTEYRAIDYYENSGEGLSHYVNVLQSKGYVYGKHFAPHDIEVRELGTGTSRLEIGASLGIRFEVVKQHRLEDGINALRMILPMTWFDAKKARHGVECLRYYHWQENEKIGGFMNKPEHDWSSHASDAARYFAMGFKKAADKKAISYPSLGIV